MEKLSLLRRQGPLERRQETLPGQRLQRKSKTQGRRLAGLEARRLGRKLATLRGKGGRLLVTLVLVMVILVLLLVILELLLVWLHGPMPQRKREGKGFMLASLPGSIWVRRREWL